MKAIITFLKNWTLPSAIVGGTVIYLIFYWIPALDPVSEVMEPIFDTILPLFMSLILFTTFLRVDFHKMRPAMWHLWVSVFQVVLVALLVALILGFDMQGKDLILMEGILTCVICPGASAAPVVTGKLGGNLETMTSYVFLSNLVTVVAVPVVFPLIDKGVDIDFWTAFWMIMYKVFLVLVLPLIAAYFVKHYLPRVQQRLVAIQDLSFYMWGVSRQEYHQQWCSHRVSGHDCVGVAADLPGSVCRGTVHRTLLWHRHRERSGSGTKEYCLCRLDCLHLSESALSGWPRLLHPVAECHQQPRNMAPPKAGCVSG